MSNPSRQDLIEAIRIAGREGNDAAVRKLSAMLDAPQTTWAGEDAASARARNARPAGASVGGMVGAKINAPRKPRTWGERASMYARAGLEGLGQAVGTVDALTGRNIASSITGAPTQSQQAIGSANAMSDAAGFAKPRDNTENMQYAGVRGVTSAIPTIMLGGPFAQAWLPQLVGGGTSGLAGEGTRQLGGGDWAQTAASLAGGVAGFGAAGGFRAPRQPATQQYLPGVNTEVVEAGQRARVPVRAPDAMPVRRAEMAKAEASPYGGGMVRGALDADEAIMQTRLAQTGGPGNVHSGKFSLGSQVQGVGQRFIDKSRGVKNSLYTRAEHRAGGARVVPSQTIAEVDNQIAELTAAGANTNSAQINYLRGLREDLAKPGGFSITEFQGLRSQNSAKIRGDNALTASDADRRLGIVMDRFTKDAEAQLPKPAVGALKTADAYYRQRQDLIDKVLKQYMGGRNNPLAPERAAERITAAANNRADYNNLSRLMAKASPEERADIAATLAENLGKGRNGEFSLGALATNIDNMPGNIRGLLFGRDGAAALDDLRILARAKSDTTKGLNNSRSGMVTAGLEVGKRAVASATAGAVTGGWFGAVVAPVVTETAAVIGQRRAASLLLNPKFTRVVRASNGQSRQVLSQRLAVVAVNNPALRDDIGVFLRAMNDNATTRLAADPVSQQQQEDQAVP